MPFSKKVSEDLLVKCNRSCCLCHKYCGTKIEIHHIIPEKEKDGSNKEDDGIPLCFDCHADVRAYDTNHPKGKKFTPRELRQHKENWIKKCSSLSASRDLDKKYKRADKNIFSQLYKLASYEFVDYISLCLSTKDWIYLTEIEDLNKITDFFSRPDKEFFSVELIPVTKKFFKSIVDIDTFLGKHHTTEIQNNREVLFPNWKRNSHQRHRRDEYNQEMRDLAKHFEESYYSLIRTFRSLFPEFVIPNFQEVTYFLDEITIKATFESYPSCDDDEIKIQTKSYCRNCKIPLKEVYGATGAYGGIQRYECPVCGLRIDPELLRKNEAESKSKIIKEFFSS